MAHDVIEADFQALPLAACAQAAIEAARGSGPSTSMSGSPDSGPAQRPPATVGPWEWSPTASPAWASGSWSTASGDSRPATGAPLPRPPSWPARCGDGPRRCAGGPRAGTARARARARGAAWANPVAIDPSACRRRRARPPRVPQRRTVGQPSMSNGSMPASRHIRDITFYADSAGTRTLQQRTRVPADVTAFRVDRSTRFDDMSHLRPAGGPRLGVPGRGRRGTGTRSSPRCPSCWPRSSPRPGRAGPLRPRHRPDQPVADHPRVRRPRHRARPGAGLRGQLRRHLASPRSTSWARCSTARR